MCEEVIYTTSYPVHKYFQCNLPCSLFPVLPDINDELQGPRAWQSQKMEGTWIPGFLLGREPPKVVTLTRNICTEFLCEKLIFIALSHKILQFVTESFANSDNISSNSPAQATLLFLDLVHSLSSLPLRTGTPLQNARI